MLDKVLAWRGVIALGTFALICVWLAWEGMLGFYIHPRYNLFTIGMAGLGLAFIILAALSPVAPHHHGAHRHAKGHSMMEWLSLGLVGSVVVLALVIPPTTLSSFTAENRSFGSLTASPGIASVDVGDGVAGFDNLNVRDWASLLVQTQDPAFYRGKPFSALGTVFPSANADVFYLTRFVVTCCAVDAQPVSIPVYYPGWQAEVGADSWVVVSGGFQVLPAVGEPGNLVVVPTEITVEEVPREPYLY